jgi:phage terminase large subunit
MQVGPLFEKLVKTNILAYSRLYSVNKEGELKKAGARDRKYIVCQGGGDAGKTVTIIQYLCTICKAFDDQMVLIAAQSMPNLKKGALRAFQRYCRKDFNNGILSFNKTENILVFKNGSEIHFKSYQNEDEARGAEWDYVFFNEANSFSYDIFWQVQRKTRKQVILDYNPTSRFWAHEKLVDGKEKQFNGRVVYFQVDHRHNPFLSPDQHKDYENISDPNLFKVYARGETGILKGLIFSATQIESMPTDCERFIWGLDYGYSCDETAIVKIGIKGKDRFIHECFYQSCEDAEIIKQVMVENGWVPEHSVYSEHDKRIILELVNQGMPVFFADKRNKVSNISKMRTFNLFYTKESINFKSEIESYKWTSATNLTTGEEIQINKPIDGNDHLIDASLYANVTDALAHGL